MQQAQQVALGEHGCWAQAPRPLCCYYPQSAINALVIFHTTVPFIRFFLVWNRTDHQKDHQGKGHSVNVLILKGTGHSIPPQNKSWLFEEQDSHLSHFLQPTLSPSSLTATVMRMALLRFNQIIQVSFSFLLLFKGFGHQV